MSRASAFLACLVLSGCGGNDAGDVTVEQCLAKVEALGEAVDAGAGFAKVDEAYKAAKDAMDAVKDDEDERCKRAYTAIRGDTEQALRRDNLSVTGWIMAFFAATVLWGGCATCITLAMKASRLKREAEEHAEE